MLSLGMRWWPLAFTTERSKGPRQERYAKLPAE
jgi:hypothetical protein